MNVLVTGAAGFIGFHVSQRLLARGINVVGLDNLNTYYDVCLKEARLMQLYLQTGFSFYRLDLANCEAVQSLFQTHSFQYVIHLAAQAGVRYSLQVPHAYVDSNVGGFLNVLEGCRHTQVQHLIYASSSSVYGANTKIPSSVQDSVDHPISLYAATKRANELMAHCYSHLFGLPTTGLRFFTVYGPWGRPDMALTLFAQAILDRRPIDVFGEGKMERDYTFVDDIVEGVMRVLDKGAPEKAHESTADANISTVPYKLYNIGNGRPVEMLYVISLLEECLGIRAEKNLLSIQPGDVPVTCADIEDFARDIGYRPSTSIEVGIPKFVQWYRSFYES